MPRRKLSKSPQAIWSRKMKALGKCPRCARKRRTYKQLCDRCTGLFSAYLKQWRKRKKEKESIHGNPPIDEICPPAS